MWMTETRFAILILSTLLWALSAVVRLSQISASVKSQPHFHSNLSLYFSFYLGL